jgi:hypothetical protein
VAWHYEQMVLSLVIMLGLLFTLTVINIGLSQEKQQLLKIIFGVYLGWILIATVANTTAGLVSAHWAGLGIGEVTWTIVLIVAGVAIAAFNIIRLDNPYLAISVAWAFLGIVIKRSADQPSIVMAAKVAIVLVIASSLYTAYKLIRLKTL